MKRIYCVLTAFILLLSLTACVAPAPETEAAPSMEGQLQVHFVDVGQADCILLQSGGEAMLVDGGNVEDSDLVVSYLLDQGVEQLRYVVGTHAHEDHIGGLAAVLAVIPTEEVWCPVTEYDTKCFRDFAYYADQQELSLICPDPGSVYTLGEATISVLGPVYEYEDTNNTSIVLKVQHGQNSFLLTGDAEADAELDILDEGFDVSATVLKVGHHGSDTSTCYPWLREVQPEYGVISCGKDNDYGHPHEEPLSRLRDAEVTLYRTDLQGHIVCLSDGTDVTFTTGKQTAVTNPTAEDRPIRQTEAEYYIGNRNSQKLHLPTCTGLPAEKNQVLFETWDDAITAGYAPCGTCMGN